MKNLKASLGIIALVAVIGFSMAACVVNASNEGGLAPNTPSGLQATANSSSSITISWNRVSGADGYNVYRSLSASGSYNKVGDTLSTAYTDTGLSANTTYYYRVTAYNDDGESSRSSSVSETTDGGGGPGPGGNAPSITTSSLAGGTVGTSYSAILNASGDTPITWSVSQGSLPGGLSLSGNTISGTPTTAGTSNFTVRAQNSIGSDTRALSIAISQGGGGGGQTFNTIAEFNTWLRAQTANSAASAYNVRVNINNIGGAYNTSGSLGGVFWNNGTKFVNLDLSGSTVTSIPENAFNGRTNLTGITLPSSINSIANGAFQGCTGLTSITVPSNVSSLGNNAFRSCTGLTSVSLNNGLTGIGAGAFYGCNSITNINIPGTVNAISNEVFRACTSLTSITIGSGVTAIGNLVFYGCNSLTSVTLNSGITAIGTEAFRNCTSLQNITIPNTVNGVGANAFRDCSSLRNVTLGSSLASISNDTFNGCISLNEITIPSSVKAIGGWAFYNCTGLSKVVFQGTIPATAFSSSSSFPGNLRTKFYETDKTNGTPGTYTGGGGGWTKQ